MNDSLIAASDFKARCLRLLDESRPRAQESDDHQARTPGRKTRAVRVPPRNLWRDAGRGGARSRVTSSTSTPARSGKPSVSSTRAMLAPFLLDTHILSWWTLQPSRVSRAQRHALRAAAERGDSVGISAITLWELAMMADRGRIEPPMPVDLWLAEIEGDAGIDVLPVTGDESRMRASSWIQGFQKTRPTGSLSPPHAVTGCSSLPPTQEYASGVVWRFCKRTT